MHFSLLSLYKIKKILISSIVLKFEVDYIRIDEIQSLAELKKKMVRLIELSLSSGRSLGDSFAFRVSWNDRRTSPRGPGKTTKAPTTKCQAG